MTSTLTRQLAIADPDAPRPSRRPLPVRILRAVVLDWGSLILLGIVWEILGHALRLTWLPPLSSVVVELVRLFAGEDFLGYLLSSLSMFAIGLVLAVAVGLVVGTLMGLSSRVYAALDIYVNALMVTPSLIFAPILFAIFGLSDITRISVVFLYGVFVIIINTSAGIRTVDQPLLDMAASYGARPWATVRRVVIPAAFPLTVAGLRLAVGRCVKGMINGEMFIALVGIGGVVSTASKSHNYSAVWAISLLLMLIAILLNQVVSRAEKKFTSWVG
ncbi:ABC transporter permease subunit [Leucobacter sp. CSA1]|uniref:ABC transporter permease subunit n=1 Tax=Leucobacter chromiisoli TaxID=2796471 RepID=A0A934Q5R9_9MICO|nr:ABC transporter permease subunit [Leucobacter chromiisoli]MBK0417883.1 ABC transporter permease subunit [Leucobacter chromiisoli]